MLKKHTRHAKKNTLDMLKINTLDMLKINTLDILRINTPDVLKNKPRRARRTLAVLKKKTRN